MVVRSGVKAMTLQQLRCFLALCNEGNFSRAARSLGISQPSLSKSIRLLESELGGQLFLRKPNGNLTDRARSILPLVQSALRDIDAAAEIASRIGEAGEEFARKTSGYGRYVRQYASGCESVANNFSCKSK